MARLSAAVVMIVGVLWLSCGDGTEADKAGIGAECTKTEDCQSGQQCLPFKGGYCGLQACTADEGCPRGSACVTHTDGVNYCFRICVDKADCNRNRSVENESNCSSNINFVTGTKDRKACVPPTGS
jgi:hypothetical protein